ncbi:MAG: hypothetical protein L0G23_10160, partial [Ruaniaceae bacterium]|nr:hypothetical protein [Ruaniaceae bacterium]
MTPPLCSRQYLTENRHAAPYRTAAHLPNASPFPSAACDMERERKLRGFTRTGARQQNPRRPLYTHGM